MRRSSLHKSRVLVLDPFTKGFGFVVLEGTDKLVDWGLKYVPVEDKNGHCLKQVERLLRIYRPDILILEDCSVKTCRRRSRARRLIEDIAALATQQRVKTRHVSMERVRRTFEKSGTTKHQIAMEIASGFTEFASYIPHILPRKIWMAEDDRMSIFDAAAMALSYYRRR